MRSSTQTAGTMATAAITSTAKVRSIPGAANSPANESPNQIAATVTASSTKNANGFISRPPASPSVLSS